MNTISHLPAISAQTDSAPPPKRRIRKWSISWTISLAMIGVVAVVLVLSALINYNLLAIGMVSGQESLLIERVEQQVQQIRGFRDEHLLMLRRIATNTQLTSSDDISSFLQQILLTKDNKDKKFSALALIDTQGKVIGSSSDQVNGLNFAGMAWFEEANVGFTGISHIQMLPTDSSLSNDDTLLAFFFYTPVGTSTDHPKQILVGILPAAEIWSYVDPVRYNKSGYAFMADDRAVLIGHGMRDESGIPSHKLILSAIGSEKDARIRNANAESMYGEKKIDTGLQVSSLAGFILNLPKDKSQSHVSHYYFSTQKTTAVLPIGIPPALGTPVSIDEYDWVMGITVNDADFLGPLLNLRQTLIWVSGFGILLSGLIGMLVSITISKPSRELAKLVERVENGDYSARAVVRSGDEIGQLATALNEMLDRLTQSLEAQDTQIETLRRTGEGTSQGAVSLSSATEQMASAIEELNASAEQVGEAIQSMAKDAGVQMNHVQETAKQIHTLDQEIGKIAGLSNDLNQASGQMRELSSQAEQSIQQAHQLSRKVQTVLHLIEKFGRQTNMLALNATIEAARAGEMGSSFVVVADEVRRLAESSEQALQEIDALNKAIQQSVDAVQTSVGQTGKAIQVVAEMAAELSAAASRQSQTSTGLVEVTNQLAAIAETNAAGAEEIASSIEQQSTAFDEISSSSHELAVLAQKLQTLSQQLADDQQPEKGRAA